MQGIKDIGAAEDPPDEQPVAGMAKSPRPRDAATLLLVRRHAGRPQVLLGQRSKGHVFMPDKWVFPGGRVDRGDAFAHAASELPPETEALLRHENPRRAPRAFAMAAVRETFEEAGLIVGRAGHKGGAARKGWEAFYAHACAPDLAKFAFIGRAITPPLRARRFDARFFMADAEAVLLDDRPVAGGEELLHTRWFDLDEAAQLDLPTVTRFMIGEAAARLKGEPLRPAYFRWRPGGRRMERL